MEKLLKFLKKYYLCFVIIVVAFSLDLLTKYIATVKLLDGETFKSVEVINNFFYFTYTRNTGGAWSMLSGNLAFFIIITLIAIGFFVYFLTDFDIRKRPLYSVGFSLIFGGTLGNFYERLVNHYVTDFFDFIIFGYDYPIFNVADVCLVIGMIMLIVQLLFFSKQVTIFDKHKKNDPLKEQDKKEDATTDNTNTNEEKSTSSEENNLQE